MNPLLVNYPTLQAECHDTETRSLKKIDDILFQFVYGASGGGGQSSVPGSLKDIVSATKGCDIVLATSGAFVSQFTLFTGPCVCWQIDCFSIAPSTRWIFVIDFDSYQPSQFPKYIAPIYSNCATSLMITAPFKRGVNVALSTAPSFPCQCDTQPYMLVTATSRNCP